MKHATPAAMAELAALLVQIRALGTGGQRAALVERRPGIFYRRGQAFLHFHEDPAGLFADLRAGGAEFVRWAVNTLAQQAELLAAVARAAGR